METLKQDQFQPLAVEKQVLIIFAGGKGYLDDLEVADVRRFERELYPFVETNHPNVFQTLRDKKTIDDALQADMIKALDAFKERFKAGLATAAD